MAVLVVAVIASELGKAVSKETKVDIIVTPAVTILGGCGLALVETPFRRGGLKAPCPAGRTGPDQPSHPAFDLEHLLFFHPHP